MDVAAVAIVVSEREAIAVVAADRLLLLLFQTSYRLSTKRVLSKLENLKFKISETAENTFVQ